MGEFDPRWYVDGTRNVLCFRHAQQAGISERMYASELRRLAKWSDPQYRFYCRDCDRRRAMVDAHCVCSPELVQQERAA